MKPDRLELRLPVFEAAGEAVKETTATAVKTSKRATAKVAKTTRRRLPFSRLTWFRPVLTSRVATSPSGTKGGAAGPGSARLA